MRSLLIIVGVVFVVIPISQTDEIKQKGKGRKSVPGNKTKKSQKKSKA